MAGNLIVLLVLLALVEIALRILKVGNYGSAPLNKDPVFHHVHEKNYHFTSYSPNNEFSNVPVFFDQDGLVSHPGKDTLQKNGESIVFLGDSFVEAIQVAYDSSFIGRLRQIYPEKKMLNYGVSSYSPVLYYLLVRHRILKMSPPPSQVFILLYSNDPRDDEMYLKQARYDQAGELVAIDGGTPNHLIRFLRNLNLARLIRKTQITLQWRLQQKNTAEKQKIIHNYIEENPEWEHTKSAEYILKTFRLLEEKGIKCILSVVPSKYANLRGDFEFEEFSEKVERWAAAHSIIFADLTRPFQNWHIQQKSSLFFKSDIHFNHLGHVVVAKVFAKYISLGQERETQNKHFTSGGIIFGK